MKQPIRLAVPMRTPADVIPHLGSPTHWRQGRSAKALADSWFSANGLPSKVKHVLAQAPEYASAELLDGWLERETDLGDGRSTHSQTDLLALLGLEGSLAVLAVEGKVDEPFDKLVPAWLGDQSQGKTERLARLRKALKLETVDVADLRYQLFHRTMSAVLEAKRFRADKAVLLVHSFCARNSGFQDFARFFTRRPSSSISRAASASAMPSSTAILALASAGTSARTF